ncbi:MAG: hypothetical protein ROY99_06390 [Ignavibacterium sp.]|jgi:predicted CopG family antitoxin|nr:hypothetical protein [Ignavibacterium sp.]
MSYRVSRVSTREELKDFITLPFKIYKDDKNWVAPIKSELVKVLDPRRNPYFKFATIDLFNCYSGNEVISRIFLSVNKSYCDKSGTRTAFFGFFESYNNPQAVRTLFKVILEFCRNKGIRRIEGPFNPNLYSELGLLLDKYDYPVTFFQTYNPEYYHSLLKENGFELLETLHTRSNPNSDSYLNYHFPKPLNLELESLSVRSFNEKNKEQDLEHLRNIFNDAFSDNWHFTPVSNEEYAFASKHLKLVTPPDLLQFVEYKGEPVAAVHFVLDINPLLKRFKGEKSFSNYIKFLFKRKKINKAIVFAIGIKKNFRNSGVKHLLFNATVEIARKFRSLETTWMYDENKTIISLAERLGLKRDKEFLVYFKNISN